MSDNQRDWTLEFAQGVFRDGIEQLVDKAAPGLTERLATDLTAWDELIGVTNLAVIESEALLSETVIAARNAGRTWTQIGAALGISRSDALLRFSAQTDPPMHDDDGTHSSAASQNPTAWTPAVVQPAVASSGNNTAVAQSEDPILSRQLIRDLPFYSVDPLNDAGKYGWHSVRVATNSSITGVDHLMEFDTQQWEHASRVPRKRREVEGWQKLKVEGPTVGISYWARPLGIPALPGKPEPQRFAFGQETPSARRLNAANEWLANEWPAAPR